MTPDKLRLSGLTNSKKEFNKSFIGSSQKQILLTPEEAVVMMHGEIETVRDGNVTHQAIQTNLADVICGGKCDFSYYFMSALVYDYWILTYSRSLRVHQSCSQFMFVP